LKGYIVCDANVLPPRLVLDQLARYVFDNVLAPLRHFRVALPVAIVGVPIYRR
jgi:hypothetical protein